MAWLQELEVPLVVRNEAMLQAGYAPAYTAMPLHDPALAKMNSALQQLLDAHDPMPALVIDIRWNLLRLNRGGQWLATTLIPEIATLMGTGPVNMLDLLADPLGLTKLCINLHEVGPHMLALLRHEVVLKPDLITKVDAFETLLRTRLGTQHLHSLRTDPIAPVLTTRYATKYGELAFFSMFTTFGTPQDITLESLRVEHMFAADEATHQVFRTHVL